MKSKIVNLPDLAITALGRGDKIEAIKLVREQTGVSLKEAKDMVDAYKPGTPVVVTNMSQSEIPLAAIGLLNEGKLLEAIKATRQLTGVGLKDAKQLVEDYLATHPDTKERFKAINDHERNSVLLIILIVAAVGAILYFGLQWLEIV